MASKTAGSGGTVSCRRGVTSPIRLKEMYGTFSCGEKDRIVHLNKTACEILGIPSGTGVRGRSFRELFGMKPSERRKILSAMKNDSGRYLGEVVISRPDGSVGVLLFHEEMSTDERGRFTGTTGYFLDVTTERKWERELFNIARNVGVTLEERKIIDRIALDLSRIVGCHMVSVVLFDEDGIKVHVRSSVKIGKKVINDLSRRISKGIGIFLEYSIEFSDMKIDVKVLDCMSSVKYNLKREVRSYFTIPLLVGTELVGFIHLGSFVPMRLTKKDRNYLMTCASQIAFALHNARSFEKQSKLIQMKSAFLANLSHALRTPMATMKQSVSLLLRERGGALNDLQKKFLGIMEENVDRLTGVLNNLLDLSKIEYGSMELNRTEMDIVLLIRSVADTFEAAMINKGIKFKFSSSPGAIRAFVDSEIMRQIVDGILGNAVKFTPRNKSIEIKIRGTVKRVMVSVKDEGCGMSKANLAMAFDKFRSFQRGIKAGVKGTGLGLALTKELVELHGGKIWIESRVRRGTEVCFVIPRMPFASILQEKMGRSMELAGIKGEGLILFLFIANLDGLDPTAGKIKRLRDRLSDYLGPLINTIEGQMIIDEEEERVAVIAPVKSSDSDGVYRAIKGNFKEILAESHSSTNSLFSWVRYPDEGNTFAELLKALLERAGISGEGFTGGIHGGDQNDGR